MLLTMYAAFFGLRYPPFDPAGRPESLFRTPEHTQELEKVLAGLARGPGLVLLSAATGDTCRPLCRWMLKHLPAKVRVAGLMQPRLAAAALLRTVCEAFEVPIPSSTVGDATLIGLLRSHLGQSQARGQHNLLLINDAEALPVEHLRRLMPLTQPHEGSPGLLRIVLVGQPELMAQMERPELADLAAAVVDRHALEALDAQQSAHYVRQMLLSAGAKDPLPFSDAALKLLHRQCGGHTRRIDQLAEQALRSAAQRQQPQVDSRLISALMTESTGAAEPNERPRGLPAVRPALVWGGAALATGALAAVLLWPAAETPMPSAPPSAAAAAAAPAVTPPADALVLAPAADLAPVTPAPEASPPQATTPLPAPAAAPAPAPSPAPMVAPAPPAAPVARAAAIAAAPQAGAEAARPSLADLNEQLPEAWQALGALWSAQLAPATACDDALKLGLQCFRAKDMDLDALRKLDRPGSLLLREQGVDRWVRVLAIDKTHLSLASGQTSWRLPVGELGALWGGSYASLWRLPPGQQQRVFNATEQDPAGQWLHQQLKALQAKGQLPASADSFPARVAAFQVRHKLHGEGKALPSTFVLMNRIAGVQEPSLGSAQR
jgi:general secretion pathway protein A